MYAIIKKIQGKTKISVFNARFEVRASMKKQIYEILDSNGTHWKIDDVLTAIEDSYNMPIDFYVQGVTDYECSLQTKKISLSEEFDVS